MPLSYLKIDPKNAIQILEACILSGHQVKDKINQDYSSDKTKAGEKASEWQKISNEWCSDVLQELDKIYVSPTELYNFRDTAPSPFVKQGSIKWNNIINQLEARIGKLNEYNRYIREQSNVIPEIHMEIIGRDRITQNGESSSITIDNRKNDSPLLWYSTWWGQIFIGLIIVIIGGGILYLTGWNK